MAELNLPFAAADHLAKLIKVFFPDYIVVNPCTNEKTKTTCILNMAICVDFTSKLITKVKSSPFSLPTDRSNDQNSEKMCL